MLSSLTSVLHPYYSSIHQLLIAIVKANITPPLLTESIGAFRGGAPHDCPTIPTDWMPSAFIESSAHFFRGTHAISVSFCQLVTPITFFGALITDSQRDVHANSKLMFLERSTHASFPCHLSPIQFNKLGIANAGS